MALTDLDLLTQQAETPALDWIGALAGQAPAPAPEAPMQEPVAAPSQLAPDVGRRERYIQENMSRPSDRDIQVAWMIGSLLGDTSKHDQLVKQREDYDKTALNAMGQDDWQRWQAAQLDTRNKQMDANMRLAQQKLDQQSELAMQNADLRRELADQANTTRLQVADKAAAAKAKGKDGGAGGAPSPEAQAEANKLMATLVRDSANVSLETAQSFVDGTLDTSKVDPKQLEAMTSAATQFQAMRKADPKKFWATVADNAKREAASPDKIATAEEQKRNDPEKRNKARLELLGQKRALANAIKAWNEMSPAGKQLMAKVGGSGGTFAQLAKSAGMSAEDQARAASIQQLADELIKARSGAAVTGSEWTRVASEMGFPIGDFSVFNSTKNIGAWLQRSKQAYQDIEGSFLTLYPDLWGK